MKTSLKFVLPAILFIGLAAAAYAQTIKTWLCPASAAGAITNSVAANQVMEIMSGSFDSDSKIEISQPDPTGSNTNYVMVLGTGGGNFVLPFVVAGPAVVVFRKTSTSGQGLIVSYRISQQQ